MKVLQISGQRDVKPNGETALHFISERFSQPMPYNETFPPDLAAVIAAWDRLPDGVRQPVVMLVKAGSGM
jgi:hypothetical protein